MESVLSTFLHPPGRLPTEDTGGSPCLLSPPLANVQGRSPNGAPTTCQEPFQVWGRSSEGELTFSGVTDSNRHGCI